MNVSFVRSFFAPNLGRSKSPANPGLHRAPREANGTVEILRFAQDDNTCYLLAGRQWTGLKIGHYVKGRPLAGFGILSFNFILLLFL